MKLIASTQYQHLSPARKKLICNGAGAAGDWKSMLIPNTMWGLSCLEAFNIHDYDYYIGRTIQDKERADTVLLLNLVRIINKKGGILRVFRKYRAMTYYEAVYAFGDEAFFTKEKGNELS